MAGGINTYGYVAQNPISRIDPTGLLAPFILIPAADAAVNLIGIAVVTIAAYEAGVYDGLDLFPDPTTDTGLPPDAANDDDYGTDDCPTDEECELWYNRLIIQEIKIREDAKGAPPGANEITNASNIRARKIQWNKEVDAYNRVCPRKIGRRFKV